MLTFCKNESAISTCKNARKFIPVLIPILFRSSHVYIYARLFHFIIKIALKLISHKSVKSYA